MGNTLPSPTPATLRGGVNRNSANDVLKALHVPKTSRAGAFEPADFFELFGLDKDDFMATKAEEQAALLHKRRNLLKQKHYHPDKGGSAEQSTLVDLVHDTLADKESRMHYAVHGEFRAAVGAKPAKAAAAMTRREKAEAIVREMAAHKAGIAVVGSRGEGGGGASALENAEDVRVLASRILKLGGDVFEYVRAWEYVDGDENVVVLSVAKRVGSALDASVKRGAVYRACIARAQAAVDKRQVSTVLTKPSEQESKKRRREAVELADLAEQMLKQKEKRQKALGYADLPDLLADADSEAKRMQIMKARFAKR